jgi:hypothetical protein
MKFICPVCDWPNLREKPDCSFEICPQCGTEFGYDDAGASHADLRAEWVAGGRKFWRSSNTTTGAPG